MSALILPSRFRQQPQGAVRIDWSSPLLKDVELVSVGEQFFSRPVTFGGTKATDVSGKGRGLLVSGSGYYYYPLASSNGGSNGWTIAAVLTPRAPLHNDYDWGIAGVCDSPGSGTFDRQIENHLGVWSARTYDGGTVRAASTKAFVDGVADTVIACADGANIYCSVAGAPEVSTAVGSVGYTGYSTATFCVGKPDYNNSGPVLVSLMVRVGRCWNAEERRAFLDNPWQIFKAPPRFYFAPSSGGGGGATDYTLTCAVGAYTTSGKASTLGLARKLTCDTGAYTTTGIAATLTYVPGAGPITYTLTCSTGAYAFSGKTATLTVNRNLACDVGAYTTSGKSATLLVERRLVCATGNYTVSGKDATLTYVTTGPISYTLTCSVGTYVVSGKAATLIYVSNAINVSDPEYTVYAKTRSFKRDIKKRPFRIKS